MKERRLGNDTQHSLNRAGYAVAIILCFLLGFALYALVSFDVRATNHDILLVVITFLTTKISTIVDFFYGGSAAGRKQQETIATLANTAGAAQAALPSVPGSPADATVALQPGETAKVTAAPNEETP